MRVRYRAALSTLVLGMFLCGRVIAAVQDTVRGDVAADSAVAPAVGPARAAADSAASGERTAADSAERPALRRVADSTVTEWQAERAFAYANDPRYWRREDRNEKRDSRLWTLLTGKWAGRILLFLLGAILLYAILRIIADNNLQLFYRSPKRQAAPIANHEPSPIEDDLEGRLQQYLQAGDYRQAVRYLYLMSLRLLNERGLITYHQEATNREYWQQLGETPQGPPFRDLTMIYEKVWYGEFPLGDPLFRRVQQFFEDFYKTVRA
ncbi:MAG TPA: DUF4129 domain-containing protein [Puia sp.]|nr:DUF4129 domain-containing protein [Puia sp.]